MESWRVGDTGRWRLRLRNPATGKPLTVQPLAVVVREDGSETPATVVAGEAEGDWYAETELDTPGPWDLIAHTPSPFKKYAVRSFQVLPV